MADKIDLAPLRGMRDFSPKDWVFRKKLINAFQMVSEKYGFLQYDTCVLDSYELFERKAGEEISEQIYEFHDKSDRHLALRPEITPTLVRLYAGEKETLPFPAKLYSFGQCFRYERPTKGRYREHYQWNIDIMGEKGVSAEAWLLYTAIGVMAELGFTADDYRVRISSRELLSDFLTNMRVDASIHAPLMTLIDKKEKVDQAWLRDEMAALGVTSEQINRLFGLLETHELEKIGKLVGESNAFQQLKDLNTYAKSLGYAEYIQFDPSIIRGLSYYTGIVFEAFDNKREFRAIFGGGRYDNLFTHMIGKDIPTCGMGFGDGVIKELYTSKFGYPETYAGVTAMVGYFDDTLKTAAMEAVRHLNDINMDSDFALSAQNFKKFFTAADKRHALIAVYLAPEEFARGEAVYKNMQTGKQKTLNFRTVTTEEIEELIVE